MSVHESYLHVSLKLYECSQIQGWSQDHIWHILRGSTVSSASKLLTLKADFWLLYKFFKCLNQEESFTDYDAFRILPDLYSVAKYKIYLRTCMDHVLHAYTDKRCVMAYIVLLTHRLFGDLSCCCTIVNCFCNSWTLLFLCSWQSIIWFITDSFHSASRCVSIMTS